MNTDSKIIIERSKDVNVFAKHLLYIIYCLGDATNQIPVYADDTALCPKYTGPVIRDNSFCLH